MIELHPDLVTAVRAASVESDLPAQGFAELRDHLLDGGPEPDADVLEAWMRAQSRAQAFAVELIDRLEPATPGNLPAHHLEWWFRVLPFPWAEELVLAVTYAFLHAGDA